MKRIEVKNLKKQFNTIEAVKGIDFQIEQNETLALLGPNGCGKTTLFSMCIGEQSVDDGKIFLNNKSIERVPIHLRADEGLGYLPQHRSVFDLTVFNNLLGIAQLFIKGTENQIATVEKLLDAFNLQHLRSLNASVLSGGETRRVMLARLMINKPKIILLDEPYAALDPQIIQDIQKYIFKIQSAGVSIVITDHNIRNLFETTDRNIVISDGSVIAEGTSRELLNNSKAVSQYFGKDFTFK